MNPLRKSFWLLALALPLAALERIDLREDIALEPLTATVWRHVTTREGIPANGLVVLCGQEAVLVDTPWTPEQTAVLLDWLEKSRGVRVTLAIPGHFHVDCLGGLTEIHRRGIRSLGAERTRELALASGVEAPREAFTKELALTVAGRRLLLLHPGPGHTADNIVVWIPDQRVLFGGCLVKSMDALGLGYTADADVPAWPGTIRLLQARFPSARLVVPGHGLPGGVELLAHTLRLLAGAV